MATVNSNPLWPVTITAKRSNGFSQFAPAGVQLGLNFLSNLWNQQNMERSWEKQEQARREQNAFNAREAQKQRDAASVTSYIRQLKQMGFNTDLLYGQGVAQGSMSSAAGGNIGSYLPSDIRPLGNGVVDALKFGSQNLLDIQMKEQQLRSMKLENERKEVENSPEMLDLVRKAAALDVDIKTESKNHLQALANMLNAESALMNIQTDDKTLDYLLKKAFTTGEVDERIKESKAWIKLQKQFDADLAELGVKEKFPLSDVISTVLALKERYGDFDWNDPDIADKSIANFAQLMAEKMYSISSKYDEAWWADFIMNHITGFISSVGNVLKGAAQLGKSKNPNIQPM